MYNHFNAQVIVNIEISVLFVHYNNITIIKIMIIGT